MKQLSCVVQQSSFSKTIFNVFFFSSFNGLIVVGHFPTPKCRNRQWILLMLYVLPFVRFITYPLDFDIIIFLGSSDTVRSVSKLQVFLRVEEQIVWIVLVSSCARQRPPPANNYPRQQSSPSRDFRSVHLIERRV